MADAVSILDSGMDKFLGQGPEATRASGPLSGGHRVPSSSPVGLPPPKIRAPC
jgi:hypothetical protein